MIKHNQPNINNDDKKAIIKVIESNYIGQGKKIEKFEGAMVKYIGKNGYACAVSNGTSALYLALYVLGIGKGDEVILPTYVCSALLNAIYMCQAVPVLVDVNDDDFNISFTETQKVISYKTKAIILPHIYGVPADVDKFKTLGIPIIEDCAQAIGAKYKGQNVGTIGDIAVFSFYATKLLTTGHGGMIFSKDLKYIKKAKDYRNFDYCRKYYPRFNFQMTDFQAALGLSQLKKT